MIIDDPNTLETYKCSTKPHPGRVRAASSERAPTATWRARPLCFWGASLALLPRRRACPRPLPLLLRAVLGAQHSTQRAGSLLLCLAVHLPGTAGRSTRPNAYNPEHSRPGSSIGIELTSALTTAPLYSPVPSQSLMVNADFVQCSLEDLQNTPKIWDWEIVQDDWSKTSFRAISWSYKTKPTHHLPH